MSHVKNIKLSRKNNSNKSNRNDLIKLLNLITFKLPIDVFSEPLHYVNDKATDKSFTSFVNMTKYNGKAPVVSVFFDD